MYVTISDKFKAFQNRIDDLPARVQRPLKTMFRRNVNGFIRTFQEGLRNEEFGLKQLKARTIQRKAYQGFTQPETPLYGLGDFSNTRSYINMLRVREVVNGFYVYPSAEMHWTGRIKLNALYLIHEFGAMVKRGKTIIRIPPRPAVKRAYDRFRKSDEARENKKQAVKVIMDYFKGKTR